MRYKTALTLYSTCFVTTGGVTPSTRIQHLAYRSPGLVDAFSQGELLSSSHHRLLASYWSPESLLPLDRFLPSPPCGGQTPLDYLKKMLVLQRSTNPLFVVQLLIDGMFRLVRAGLDAQVYPIARRECAHESDAEGEAWRQKQFTSYAIV